MSDFHDEELALTPEELREERIERYIEREHYWAAVASLFTIFLLAFGAGGPEGMRVSLSGLAGAFFIMAGINRFRRNLAIARRA